jgi:hypothetical protein
MPRLFVRSSWIVCLWLASATAGAEPPRANNLAASLAGKWTGTIAVNRPGQGASKGQVKVNVSWDCRKIAGDTAVDCALEARGAGLSSLRENDVIGHDQKTGQTRAMRWRSTGEVNDHRGRWTDGDTLELADIAIGGAGPGTLTLRFVGAGKITVRLVGNTDQVVIAGGELSRA